MSQILTYSAVPNHQNHHTYKSGMAISDLLVFFFVGLIAAYLSWRAKSAPRANINLTPTASLAIWLGLMLLPTLLVGWSVWVRQPFPPILLVVVTLTWIWLYFSLSPAAQSPPFFLHTPSAYAIAELSPALSYITKPALAPEAETRLKGCFPWAVFFLKQIEYNQRAIVCQGQLRYQAGSNWQRSLREQPAQTDHLPDATELAKLSPSEAIYRIISANINAEFGDRFWIFFQPAPSNAPSAANQLDDLSTEPLYNFLLLPRLNTPDNSGQTKNPNHINNLQNLNLDQIQVADIVPTGNNRAKLKLKRSATNRPIKPANLGRWILPLLLLASTIVTMLATGANIRTLSLDNFRFPAIGSGIVYAIALFIFGLTHQIARHLVAKRYQLKLSPPFVIPFLAGLGTLGSYALPQAGYLPNRRAAFHLAIVPTLAGLAIAFPLLIVGLVNSSATELIATSSAANGGMISYLQTSFATFNPQNSILLAAIAQLVTWGRFNGRAIEMHPLALAGWAGLALTAISLMPIGWLEGGDLAHAMFGQTKAATVGQIARLLLLMLALLAQSWLWIFAIAAFVIKTERSPILDEVTELKSWQDALGLILLALVLLVVLPVPKLLIPLLSLN
ncbi:hypothetical protein Pse7367_2791 [Thalassoporum mexicanum PCC 7367]|uniref:hypothetical protein n=1 Tax=Thalassoporum mexicanum TaxID=3457544 RepID=UPI00029FF177|nr:hypothetical protein [Pseudanabaena sp. PCC 7367]AFY71044.1 hypothetical protein Pse7367_2791 [Pseudanabaena sp. PCC 7367]